MKTATALATEGTRVGTAAFMRDLVQLTKPRITGMVVFTFAGGLWLAGGAVASARALLALLGTTLVVAAANTVNMYLERDIDGLMRRTRRRPLPEGRMAPFVALALGCILASAAIPLMLVSGGPLVALLGLIAFYAYVWGYTPLKRRSPLSLFVGAVPGAMPPLMGWAVGTGGLEAPGLALFGILFLWQIPHFAAIAIFRAEEYAAAGFRVISLERTPRRTRATIVLSTLALVAATLALLPLGVAGWGYGVIAGTLGAAFVVSTFRGLGLDPTGEPAKRWARSVFFHSLVYLTAIFVALPLDRLILAGGR